MARAATKPSSKRAPKPKVRTCQWCPSELVRRGPSPSKALRCPNCDRHDRWPHEQ